MRLTASDVMSAEKHESRYTVSPSFRVSWNQSRHVTRLPVQLWKYSCATTPWAQSAQCSSGVQREV